MNNQNNTININKEELIADFDKLDSAKQKEVLLQASRLSDEKTTPEEIRRNVKLAMTDMSGFSDVWNDMSTTERKKLEDVYMTSQNKEEALKTIAGGHKETFGDMPTKTVEYTTDRDIYNALKDVYDKSGGNWELVGKVIKYNDIPEDLIHKFVKDGKWTDYSVGDEAGSGIGAVARGATGGLYGGLANILTGGQYAKDYLDVVPQGITSDKAVNTLWRAGINQAENYGRSLYETDPGMEIGGQVVGMLAPVGLVGKATKGIKLANDATKLGKAINIAGRGAATGALVSIPESLAQDSLAKALSNTGTTAGTFALGDLAFQGLGAGLGKARNIIKEASKKASTIPENYVKAFEKIKPISEMTEEELARGAEKGWLKDGKLNVSKYLAEEYGVVATDTMEDLIRASKNNRQVFDQLKNELKDFHYKDAIKKIAEEASIPNAPLSRVNKVLKSIPERLEKFSDDIIGYTGTDGGRIADSMKAFNQDIKHALKEIKNPNSVEKQAIDKYLKEIESANMQQFMKKSLPTEFQVVDKAKSLPEEIMKKLGLTSVGAVIKAPTDVLKDRITRNYMRQVMAGEKRRAESTVQKLLQKSSDIADYLTPNKRVLDKLNQLERALLYKSTKE